MKIKYLFYGGASHSECSEEMLLSRGVPQSVIDEAKENQNKVDIDEQRKQAYQSESDPLFLEWQYDQTAEKEQAWRDKVAEIKARYPLPSEV